MKKVFLVTVTLLLAVSMCFCGGRTEKKTAEDDSKNIIVFANNAMSEKFSPFFQESVPDMHVVDSTTIQLLYPNRNGSLVYKGIEGETTSYNGTNYTYTGPANLVVTENKDGTVFYDYTLRKDLKCSDGVALTADDMIFSLYVYCDPTYDGSTSVYSLPILGMEEYRSGMESLFSLLSAAGRDNKDFTYWDKATQDAFWADVDQAGVKFVRDICDYCIAAGYGKAEDPVGTIMANWGFPADASATEADIFKIMYDAYEGDLVTLSDTEKANSSLTALMNDYSTYTKGVKTGDSADYVKGFQKTGDYSVRIVLTEVNAPAADLMDIYIAPLHYYGDKAQYDYKNNKFGFPKGDLSMIRAKTRVPFGAGPYKFVSYENKTVYLEANPYFYKGAPKTKYIQWKETNSQEEVLGITQGTIDISDPTVSKDRLEQIASFNSNGQITGDKLATYLVDYNGYGYIGINAQNVKVGDDRASEASKNLRKAIATVLCVYRDVVIDSYYGNAASVINYPISNCSWAAPQKSDSDYKVAFSTDVKGNPIYKAGMTEDEKYAAALNASLGFFEAAGYTVKNGKVTAAPAGAKMAYNLMIAGDGVGDHPSFGIVSQASEALSKIGFTLIIDDLTDSAKLWDTINGGTHELWCAAWQATMDPDMFQIYHTDGGSSYHYNIDMPELDELVVEGRTSTNQAFRKAIYKEALDYIVDFAVEVPVYQRQNGHLVSSDRIDINSVPKDITTYYDYYNELENLKLK
ncbi:MAG: hypothetical protein K5930_10500 [Treponemataceae bacterium]|nr:hypothetical protein [Treponemataceae bacterium]